MDKIIKKNNKKITIILPLLDKHHYTEIWLKNNIYDQYDYIIADGSYKNFN